MGDYIIGCLLILLALGIVIWYLTDERGKGPYWSPRWKRK